MLDLSGRKAKFFKDNKPGKAWWYGFLAGHPDIKLIYVKKLEFSRAVSFSERAISNWYVKFHEALEKYQITSPRQIFNCDESGFPLQSKAGKVLNRKGEKTYQLTASTKAQVIALICIGADGTALPPYFLFSGKSVKSSFALDLPEGSRIYATDSGWMTQEAFYFWIGTLFGSACRPILLMFFNRFLGLPWAV